MTTWKPPNPEVMDILSSEGVIAVLGTGRSGKTALGHLLASISPKPVYAVNYPESIIDDHCPENWNTVSQKDVFSLTDCTIIFDDAALTLASSDGKGNYAKAFKKWVTIISHKRITLMFIIQNLQLLDINSLRAQRMCILYKYSNMNNVRFEREEYRNVALSARHSINVCRQDHPEHHPQSFVYDDEMGMVWTHPLASHWCQELSTPYRDYEIIFGAA